MQRFLPATYRTLLLVSVLVVIAFLVLMLFQNLKTSDERNAMVEHTYTVLLQSERLSAAINDCDVAHLRFLVGGLERSLNLYNQCLQELPAAQAELHRLTSDNPSQQKRLKVLDDLIAKRLSLLSARIETRRKQGVAGGQLAFENDGGNEVGRRIRASLGEVVQEERTLLAMRKSAAAEQAGRTLKLTGIGSIVLLALLSFMNYILERDVVLRRRAEDEVRRSEVLFRGMFDNASVGIALLSSAGQFELVNARFCEIAQYSNDQLLERKFQSIILEDGGAGGNLLDSFVSRDPPVETRRQQCRRSDGSFLWVRVTASALPAEPKSAQRFISIVEDIDAQVQAEDALTAANESLVRSNESLQEFAYGASHDLKEPLRTILMFSDLLMRHEKNKQDERTAKYLGLISDGARRMTQLIEALLAYAQVSSEEKSSFQQVDLRQLLDETLESLRASIEQENAVIKCHQLPVVHGDPIRLHQVLQNLIGNALKYRQPGLAPEIEITGDQCANEWLITVRDNGLGFQPESAERMFAIFKRLHGQGVSGTGVGLAVVKTIVQRHGGRVWAESAGENRGATFHFTIPRGFADDHHWVNQ